nr:tyrosine-type recombinase/integrase [Mesorhizobium sp. M2A.F.Ca.ET.043.05.1.1]
MALFRSLPRQGHLALRDHTLLLFLYNTGARVQEVADLRIEHLELKPPAKVHLHGKGDKWRTCPLWDETVKHAGPAPRSARRASLLRSEGSSPNKVRDLQDCPTTRRFLRYTRAKIQTSQPAPIPAHRCLPPTGIRCRS